MCQLLATFASDCLRVSNTWYMGESKEVIKKQEKANKNLTYTLSMLLYS